MKIFNIILLCAILCVSCVKENDLSGNSSASGEASLRLPLKVVVPQERTRALSPKENDINSLHVFIFNSTGALDGKTYIADYIANPTVQIATHAGSGYTIYAVANMRDELVNGGSTLLDDVTSKTGFEAKFSSLVNNEVDRDKGMVMCGKLENVTIATGTTTLSTPLKLTRLSSRITVNVKNMAPEALGLTIVDYAVKNLPKYTYLAAKSTDYRADNTSVVDLLFDHRTTTTFENGADGAKTGIFYMLENRSGTVTAVTDPKTKPTNAPAGATYIEVRATCMNGGHADVITYKIYLGSNNSSDYNVERNGLYTYNVNIYSVNDADIQVDSRVEKVADDNLFVTVNNPLLDSHYDQRPMLFKGFAGKARIEVVDMSGNVIGGESWLKIADESNYTAAYNSANPLSTSRVYTINSTDNVLSADMMTYLYADENISGRDRSLRVRTTYVRATSATAVDQITDADFNNPGRRMVLDQVITQKSIVNVGHFGGAFNATVTGGGYSKNLGIELLEEYTMEFKPGDVVTAKKPWGYAGISTRPDYGGVDGNPIRQYGRPTTIALAENKGSKNSAATGYPLIAPVAPENLYDFTYYNSIPARYCYDKNRDLNGNGVLEDSEIKWYLPAQNQLVSLWIINDWYTADNKAYAFSKDVYFSSTESDLAKAVNLSFNSSSSIAADKGTPCNVRCVRDLD